MLRRHKLFRRLHLSVLLVGSALAPVVFAQTPGAGSGDTRLDEIVVVAQKRVQNLQETPAAVVALPSETLVSGGVTDLRAAQMFVPSVRFQAEGNNTQVFIRGVGANLDFPNVESSVAFIFNGAYVPREGTSASFFDISQVEVLPGPQGTLYGRSSVGGTVVIRPNLPEHNSDGTLLFEAGNFSAAHATYAQNFPVGDTLALRAAVDYNYNDGFNESGGDAKDDLGIRLSALYEPNDDVSLLFWVQGAEKNGHPANLVNKGFNINTGTFDEDAFLHPENPWDDTRTGDLAPLAPFGSAVADKQEYESLIVGAQLDWEFNNKKLTYIPSYFYVDSLPNYWLGTIRARLGAHYNQVAHELRLSNTNDNGLSWLGGIYLYRVRNDGVFSLFTNQTCPPPPGFPCEFRSSNITFNQIESAAAFGQVTFSATDRLRFTLGGRYSEDRREAEGFAPDTAGGAPFIFEHDFSSFDWKVGLDYDVGGESLFYVAVQTGYKPGTYNDVPSTPTFDNLVKPTDLLAYTTGYKTRLLDDTLQVNTELYYYDYSDLEVQAYDISAAFQPIFNADYVENYGAQIDTVLAVTDNARLNLNVGYTHSRNKDFVTPAGDDYSGLQTVYAPDWTVLAGYDQGFALSRGFLRAHIDARYESSWFADYVHNPGVKQDNSWKADASLTYESEGAWTLGAWIKNITDEPVIAATAAAGIPGPATAYLEPPRTYGLRATFSF